MKSVCGGKSGFKTAGTVTRSCNRLTCTMLHRVLFPHDGKHEDRFSCLWLRLIAFLPLRVSCECVGCCFFLLLFFLTPLVCLLWGMSVASWKEQTNKGNLIPPSVTSMHVAPAGEAETICFSVIEWRWSCGCPSADISAQHVRGALLIKVVFTHKGKTCGTF